jgi:hypothetical protein
LATCRRRFGDDDEWDDCGCGSDGGDHDAPAGSAAAAVGWCECLPDDLCDAGFGSWFAPAAITQDQPEGPPPPRAHIIGSQWVQTPGHGDPITPVPSPALLLPSWARLELPYHLRNISIRTGILNWLRFPYDFEIGPA